MEIFFRFYSFVLNLEYIFKKEIPGDFAELGVYKGGTAVIFSEYAAQQNRMLYLFDTFSGFSQDDLTGMDGGMQKAFTDTDLASVKQLVGHEDRCVYFPGYFPDTLTAELDDSRFAFISLDCDLYKPTKSGLEFFYPRLSAGGMIFLHDYSSGYWPGCTQAIDEFVDANKLHLVLFPDKSGSAVLQKSS